MTLEICTECEAPTGFAGRLEDSLYAGDFGPYCEDCWGDVPGQLAEIIDAQEKQIRALTAPTGEEE